MPPVKEPDYKVLFESAAGLHLVVDPDLRIIAVSDGYLRATMTQREAITGKSVFQVFPDNPGDAAATGVRNVRASFERVFATRSADAIAVQKYDMPRPAALGGGFEERYWSLQNAPVLAADGSALYLIATVEDVTGFVRLQQGDMAAPVRVDPRESAALRLMRETILRKALAVDVIGVVMWDAAGTLVAANDTFLDWGGYSQADVASGALSWQKLTPPEWHPASRAQLERLAATGRIGPYEKEYFSKDGSRRWMLFVGAGLGDGTLIEYVLDVSQRKRAEQAQRESEERYRMLFESIDAGFCVLEMIYDAQGKPADYRFLEVNPAFERQTGLKDAPCKTMREHVPDHEQHWFDTYARVAESGKPARFVHAAKALMGGWYEVHAFRVGGKDSRKVAVLFNDITERVRALDALKEADRRKDEFLATLAHELRNPLAPIRNAVSILRLKGSQEPELQTARNLIDRQVDHLVRLVEDLLDVSRITFGKVELRRERLDLRAVAEEAIATSRPLLESTGQRLTVRLAREPLWVDGDRVRLSQVISNLLNNAARYTASGGEVVLEAQAAEGAALVSVQDNGMGIPSEMLSRVFEPFMQIEPRGSVAAGIGIGLSLARMLVGLHGGEIEAESEGLGRGSRFVVRLPLAATAAVALPAKEERFPASEAAPRRFLVVDDNVDAATSQADLLRLYGHEAEIAYNGQEALEKAARFRPDVVLLDLGMPDMDGFEVARRLRQTPEGRQAVLIAQTGWGQEEDRRKTAAAGFDAHLAKPVEIRRLMEALARPARV